MPRDPNERTRRLYAERWADYVRYGIDTAATSPIAFIIEARTKQGAQQLAAELADGRFDVSRKWWPFGRRWRLTGKTRPLPLARASMDEWFEGLLRLLQRCDADLTHWVPLQAPAAKGSSAS